MITPLTITILLGLLSLIGLVNSLYFSTLYLRLFLAKNFPTTIGQQPDKSSCEIATSSSFAQTLGIPNSYFGTGFYALILAISVIRVFTGEFFILRPAAFVSGLALMFSVYLFLTLYMRLKLW